MEDEEVEHQKQVDQENIRLNRQSVGQLRGEGVNQLLLSLNNYAYFKLFTQ
jgi:hypothetical protein